MGTSEGDAVERIKQLLRGKAGGIGMLGGGVRVIECKHLPTTKTTTWRTQRKWAHRVMWNLHREHRFHSKQVPCNDVMVMGDTIIVPPAIYERLKAALPGGVL